MIWLYYFDTEWIDDYCEAKCHNLAVDCYGGVLTLNITPFNVTK